MHHTIKTLCSLDIEMKLHHNDLEIELDDVWWEEAGMKDFIPTTNSYFVNAEAIKDEKVFRIKISEVCPVRRNPGVGIFNNSKEASAKDRVISILNGFRQLKLFQNLKEVNLSINLCMELTDFIVL